MRVRISDMMDGIEDASVQIRENEIASASRIKEATMKRIQNDTAAADRSFRRFPKVSMLAAVFVLAMLCAGTAFAYFHWNGFAFTSQMSQAEKEALLQDNYAFAGESIDPDGTVHYLDAEGNDVMVLSAEEAAEYERSREDAHLQKLKESSSLLDVDKLEVIPSGIIEVVTDEQGAVEDFALGNGYILILGPKERQEYALKKEDTVTISISSNDACILEFGMIQDGEVWEAEHYKSNHFEQSFQIPADGSYNFYIMYYSADKSLFTDCTLKIEQQ